MIPENHITFAELESMIEKLQTMQYRAFDASNRYQELGAVWEGGVEGNVRSALNEIGNGASSAIRGLKRYRDGLIAYSKCEDEIEQYGYGKDTDSD